MRLIDADEVMKTINHSDVCVCYTLRMSADEIIEHAIDATKLCVKTDIDQLPTIDPVRHGRWLDIDGDGIVYQCNQCGGLSDRESAFCADCGASMMDGGGRDEADRCI